MTSLHQAQDAVHYHPVGREGDTYTSLSAFPDSHSQRAFGRGWDDEEVDKQCCRICLQEDDPDDMLAPCHCKGTAKWVHRECLDLWRTNEKDRAFSQCTECQFKYLFQAPPPRPWSRRARFCLFVSRDFGLVMVALQLVIGCLGFLAMKVDRAHDSALLGFLSGGDCNEYDDDPEPDETTQSPRFGDIAHGHRFLWCHHQLAVYYLCGVLGLLVLLGLFGSTVFCGNGCKIPNISEENVNDESLINSETRRQSAEYYQSQRRNRRHYQSACDMGDCCLDCCCYPRYGYHHFCYFSSPSYRHRHHSDGDCCACQCPSLPVGSSSSARGGGGGNHDNDIAGVLLVLLLIFLVVMAMIGFFVGIFLAVVLTQKIIQRHMFRLHKRELVQEFRVVDLSKAGFGPSSTSLFGAGPITEELQRDDEDGGSIEGTSLEKASALIPEDEQRLRKLGLME